jgi:hypothetical protein
MIYKVAKVIIDISIKCGINPSDVIEKNRHRNVSEAKSAVIYTLHSEYGISYSNLSKLFGMNTRTVQRREELVRKRLQIDKSYNEWYKGLFE